MERTLDSIRPSDVESTRDNMSYLYGRDPSILAYGERPIPCSKQNLISLYEDEEDEYTDDTGSDAIILQTVKVYLRVKPLPRKIKLTKEETEAYQIPNSTTLVTKLPSLDHNTSALKGPKTADTICRKFTFTKTFGPETTQLQLFEQIIQQKMVDFLAGRNSTIMTYGTTNSGKSYTLQGTTTSPGIIPRGLEFVFSNITTRPTPSYKPLHNNDIVSLNAVDRAQELECKNKLLTFGSLDKHHYINAYKQMQKLLQEESPIRASQACDAQYSVWVSFAEIYNENIYDLLSNDCQKRRPLLKLGTDNNGRAFIKGLKTICVNSGSEAYQVLMAGQYNLKVAATALNARSSRSHCIFTIKLLKYYLENSPDRVEVSTFAFCDLAGSERLKKTLNVGERLKEAQNINTSLLVLGRCLKSIYEGQTIKQKSINEHVGPFRESKLTRLFQRALSGKEQIALIVNVNPIPNLYVETQNVLNFSAIAKKIIIEPKQIKRRVSNSRFSQLVAQSVKSCTDWDGTDFSELTEQTAESYSDASVFIHQDEFDDIMTENKNLKKEIGILKASMLKKDLQIRQELADTYTSMMQKLETDWKNRIRDVEEQQEDELEWSVNRVETFYKEKISELTSRKRRRQSDDDNSDEERHNINELQIENSRLTAKLHSLKKTVKNLRENNENANAEKNKVVFELGLANEELKSVKLLLSSAQEDLCGDNDKRVYMEKLRDELNEKQAHIKKLKTFLDEAKEEYISITAHAGAMEIRLKDQAEQLAESQEHAADLEELLEQVNVCLAEKTKTTELLEEKMNNQSNLLHDSKLREQNSQAKLIDAEETIRRLTNKLAIIEKTNSLAKNVTPDSMLADVEIKQEILSECESETSLENSKPVIHPGIIIKTDNEILGIPVTTYDNDRESEMFVAVQEISENGKSDETETITKLKAQIIDFKIENESLKRKCEQSHMEIDSLRKSFEIVKNQLANVDKQLNDYKITTAIENEMKKLESSILRNNNEQETSANQTDDQLAKVQMKENECQTVSILGQDQTNQTSFAEPDNDDKSIQATILDQEEIVKIQNQLEILKIKCDQLEAECENKDTLIASLRAQLENHVNADELDKLKIKNDQLKTECQKKELIEEHLKNPLNEEELIKLRTKIDQLEADCQEKETAMMKLKEQLENRISEEEIEKIRAKNDQLESECQKNEKTMMKLKEQLENHISEEEIEKIRAKNDQLESECQKNEKAMMKLKEQLENHISEEEIEKIRAKNDQLESECQKNEKAMMRLKEQLENHISEEEIEKIRAKNDQLESECQKNEKAMMRLKEQLENHISEEEIEKLRIKNDQLEAECQKNEMSIMKLKEHLENDTNKEVSELLRAKYDQLEIEHKEKQMLMEKLEEELKNIRENSISLQEKSNEELRSLEKALATANAEKEVAKKTLSETNELLKTLESEIFKCRDEHELKITTLEKELTVAKIREETKSECIKVQTDKIAEVESSFTLETKKLKDKIIELSESIERFQGENKILEKRLSKNLAEIEELEKRCQIAAKKDKDKEEEIKQLQKALKNHLVVDAKKKMEETLEKSLKELNETKEALTRLQESYDRLRKTSVKDLNALENEIAELKKNSRLLEMRKKEAEETKVDIDRIKMENQELKTFISEKDREMESFMKNRDEMIAKFENLIKEKQEELERANREITKLQENLHRRTTPRDKGTKPADESAKFSIPVVDLSDSETKRTTRRTALAPPSNGPTSDKKRTTRKKRLYQTVEDSCIDLDVCEAVPPTPSPSASTRSLRTRRK